MDSVRAVVLAQRLLTMGLQIESVLTPGGLYSVRVTGGWRDTTGVADTLAGVFLAASLRWLN